MRGDDEGMQYGHAGHDENDGYDEQRENLTQMPR